MKIILFLISMLFFTKLSSKDIEVSKETLNVKKIRHYFIENLAERIVSNEVNSDYTIVATSTPNTKKKNWVCDVKITKRAINATKNKHKKLNLIYRTIVLDLIKNNYSIYDDYLDI